MKELFESAITCPVSPRMEARAREAVSAFAARHDYRWMILFEGCRPRRAVLSAAEPQGIVRSYCPRCGSISGKYAFDWAPDTSLGYALAKVLVQTGGRWSDEAYLAIPAIQERPEKTEVKARKLKLLRTQLSQFETGYCACGGKRVNFTRPRIHITPVVRRVRRDEVPVELIEDFFATVSSLQVPLQGEKSI